MLLVPKAYEYRKGSELFSSAVLVVRSQADRVDPDWRDAIVRGQCYVKSLIDRTALASRDNIGSIVNELQSLEAECDRRSGVCDAFDDKVREYNRLKAEYDAGPKDGPPPPVPSPPHSWVEPSIPIAR